MAGMDELADPFAATRASYASPEGARAYGRREAATAAGRDASCRGLLDGIALAGLRVLDLGCGTGRDVAWFRGRGAEAIGLDAAGAMLAEARRRHRNPGWWVEGDMLAARETPWGGAGSLDIAWSMASLVHVPRADTVGLLARWAGWLRPGGRIALATKLGTGEVVTRNLGEDLPRVMVYREAGEVLDPLRAAGLAIERLVADKPSAEAGSGERLMLVLARRPG